MSCAFSSSRNLSSPALEPKVIPYLAHAVEKYHKIGKNHGNLVLLSTACPTSLASEPNIRGGRSGVQTAPACGAAFGGIDNDQPEIKARQRHRARLDPKPRYPSKDFHHKEFAKKLRDGFRGLREAKRTQSQLQRQHRGEQLRFPSTSTSSAADALRLIFL